MPNVDNLPSADTARALPQKALKLVMQSDPSICREVDAPTSPAEQAATHTGRLPYTEGIPPIPRPELPGYNSAIMTIFILIFLFLTVNLRNNSSFLKVFAQNLFSVRRRANVFDERSTTSEARVLLSLIILLCFSEGALILTAAHTGGLTITNLPGLAIFSGIALTFYILQICAYSTVGYVFTTHTRAFLWLKGFNASQALLAISIAPPAVISLFYPEEANMLLSVAAALYLVARIIFIFKGFRIFYNNSLALIYFILYLCSLEIIPLFIIYKATLYCCSLL